jgi:hypothetical protein
MWPFSLAFAALLPSIACERMTIVRLTLALLVATAVVTQSAAKSLGTRGSSLQAIRHGTMLPSLSQNKIGTSELDPFRSSILGPWSPL